MPTPRRRGKISVGPFRKASTAGTSVRSSRLGLDAPPVLDGNDYESRLPALEGSSPMVTAQANRSAFDDGERFPIPCAPCGNPSNRCFDVFKDS